MFSPPQKGFTLIELLVVIGILAVLATTTALILNPAEFLAKSRDSVRVSDLTILNRALRLAELDGASSTALASRVYISLPDIATPADNCATNTGGNAYSLPPLPSGKIYWCVSAANFRSPLGGGWIPVNFTSIPQGSPLAKLPIDPVNSHVNGTYYTYTMGGSWKLTALMEANKHDQSINDGGVFPGVYEIGTNLTLTSPGRDQGLVGYWPMDEATGTTIYDASGKGNNGALTNFPALPFVTGKIGSAMYFDGTDDYINLGSPSDLNITDSISVTAWINPTASPGNQRAVIGDSDNFSQAFVLYVRNSAGQDVGFSNNPGDGNRRTLAGAGSIDYGQWSHVVGVWNSANSTAYVYINGVLKGSTTSLQASTRSFGPISIGRSPGLAGSHYFLGSVDDVRVYNRVLTASEIQALYVASQ